MRLACSTTCFPMDRLEIAIAKAAWCGFRAVELAFTGEPEMPEEELQRRLHANELQVAAVAAGELPAPSAPPEELGRAGRLAALARRLDCGLVVLTAPAGGDAAGAASALALLDRALGSLACDLCLVNRTGSLLDEPAAFARLWDHGVPRRAGIALDPAQALLAGWDPADLELLPETPRHVYLNDALGGAVLPPGEGTLDLGRLAASLREAGYAGSVSLALENAEPWAVEPAVRALHDEMLLWFGVAE